MLFLCVNVYCHRVTTQLQLINIIIDLYSFYSLIRTSNKSQNLYMTQLQNLRARWGGDGGGERHLKYQTRYKIALTISKLCRQVKCL